MRQILILAALFLLFSPDASGQNRNLKVPRVANSGTKTESVSDTIIKVTYVNKDISEREPAYYLNGQLVFENILKTINPKIIEDIRVEKIENSKERLKFDLVRIWTRTEENIRKSKEIRIRGIEEI
jgi:hypothetical protein